MSRTGRWLVAGVVVLAAVVIAVWPRGGGSGAATPQPPPAPNLTTARAKADLAPCRPGDHATPSLAGVRVTCEANGADVDLGNLAGGRAVLLNVWASWCVPCQRELPALDAYAALPGAIPVIGVQVQSQQSAGLDLLAGLRIRHLPIVFDRSGATAGRLRLPFGLPVSYLVRPDGTATVVRQPALVLDTVDQVRAAVATYLGGDR